MNYSLKTESAIPESIAPTMTQELSYSPLSGSLGRSKLELFVLLYIAYMHR